MVETKLLNCCSFLIILSINLFCIDLVESDVYTGQHNTFEVNEEAYRSCNSSTGVLAKYESGHDQVTLTEAKKYWFICDIAGHCLGGMRFSINVTEWRPNTNSTSTSEAPVQPCPPSRMAATFLVSFGILLLMY
ncbi:hypothetical protein HHK36_031174 [Tetracentron sinense]|uniref:Phytocyanin domain-containing protein n=1 Tax=Tetracentron sinense TaxID=13715 RepID=A0A834YB25_TETSI|nr:hypothetical protein HHK36_031174 [Tetracentron sinense]